MIDWKEINESAGPIIRFENTSRMDHAAKMEAITIQGWSIGGNRARRKVSTKLNRTIYEKRAHVAVGWRLGGYGWVMPLETRSCPLSPGNHAA